MTMDNLQVRRATTEDLPRLLELWKEDNLPWADLEKRFKEFQVVAGSEGELVGAIGLQISGLEGLVHSEIFAYPEHADRLRDELWRRLQILAQNYGLVRVWTQLATPFWRTNGFRPPPAEVLARLPAGFGSSDRPWLYMQLREETAPSISVEKEFALFREAEKAQTQKLHRQAKVLKSIALVLGVAVFLLVIVWAFFFIKAQGRLPG